MGGTGGAAGEWGADGRLVAEDRKVHGAPCPIMMGIKLMGIMCNFLAGVTRAKRSILGSAD